MNAFITRHERALWITVAVLGVVSTVLSLALIATDNAIIRAAYNVGFLTVACLAAVMLWPGRRPNGPTVTIACPDCGDHITLPITITPYLITDPYTGQQDIHVAYSTPAWTRWEHHLLGGVK